ncbi:MAG: hypothetical protein H8D23_09980 [Candidatus Brocadiales bacterium]|nr:hypothetical protein [Candidatus Brocadiales bacterium]
MKKKSAEQIQKELKHQRMISVEFIKDIFPDIKEIAFEFKFDDPDGPTISPNYKPSYSSVKLLPQNLALFRFECENRECVKGGFYLREEIKDMVQAHKSESSGQLICQGWQDPEREGQHRCLLELSYSVRVVYYGKS